jgi:uncharacterized membrane protein HdeD (DUF308 family)
VVRVLLLLLGSEWVREHRSILTGTGLVWLTLGVALCIDALDGTTRLPLHAFGLLILLEGSLVLFAAINGWAARRRLLYTRGAIEVLIGLLVALHSQFAEIVLAVLIGITCTVDGALRIASAVVVRFRGWQIALAGGMAEVAFAAFLFDPAPSHYAGTPEYCIGLVLALQGWNVLRLAWHLRMLPPDAPLPVLFSRGWPHLPDLPPPARNGPVPSEKLVVRVWTALGSADHPVHRPILDRYIAAVDAKGVISTGHTALEVKPDVYISHYPAVEIDQSPDSFIHLLRATKDNDVEGTFQPSYEYEARQWCESTMNVAFERYDPARLRAFWERYRQDTTYNLTNRNCSSAVVHALETAIEGVLAGRGLQRHYFIRALCSPELMAAAQVRRRAETMAWTPGLALDYARALTGVLNPPHLTRAALVHLRRLLPRRRRLTARRRASRSASSSG